MALSVVSAPVPLPGGLRMAIGTITGDSSYTSGGYAITAAQLGAGRGTPNRPPDFVVFNDVSKAGGAGTTVGPIVAYDKDNLLIHVYGGAVTGVQGLAEVTAATSYATWKASFLAIWVEPDPAGIVTI